MSSSIWSPLSLARRSSSMTTAAPSSGAGVLLRVPPNLPTAVRVAATITTSVLIKCSLVQGKMFLSPEFTAPSLSHNAPARLQGEYPFLGGVHCTSVGLANGKERGISAGDSSAASRAPRHQSADLATAAGAE